MIAEARARALIDGRARPRLADRHRRELHRRPGRRRAHRHRRLVRRLRPRLRHLLLPGQGGDARGAAALLTEHGAVSEPVARAMAEGALAASDADARGRGHRRRRAGRVGGQARGAGLVRRPRPPTAPAPSGATSAPLGRARGAAPQRRDRARAGASGGGCGRRRAPRRASRRRGRSAASPRGRRGRSASAGSPSGTRSRRRSRSSQVRSPLGDEAPVVLQVAERPLEILDVDGALRRACSVTRLPKLLAVDLERDDEVGLHHLARAVGQRRAARGPARRRTRAGTPDSGRRRRSARTSARRCRARGASRHGSASASPAELRLSGADNANRMPAGTRPAAGAGRHDGAALRDRRADLGEGDRRPRRGAGRARSRRYFAGTDKLVVVGLLRGSFVFIADLVRELDLPVEVDFLEVSSYGNATESSREVRILKDLRGEIEGRDVLVVEDIVDTGHTLNARARDPRHPPPGAARGLRAARQAVAPRGRRQGQVGRLRDPRQVRGRLRHRLRPAQPQPAAHRRSVLSSTPDPRRNCRTHASLPMHATSARASGRALPTSFQRPGTTSAASASLRASPIRNGVTPQASVCVPGRGVAGRVEQAAGDQVVQPEQRRGRRSATLPISIASAMPPTLRSQPRRAAKPRTSTAST